MAVPAWGPARASDSNPARPIRWLAPGDSYTAGYGLPGVKDPDGCVQSTSAWPTIAAAHAVRDGYRIADDGFKHVACSGAKMAAIVEQVDESGWDLVTLSAGGNDAEFTLALGACVVTSLAGARPFDWLADPITLCPPDTLVRDWISLRVGERYDGFLDTLASRVTPGGHIVVLGYPALFEASERWDRISKALGLCHGVDRPGAERIRGWAGHLNATIGASVRRADQRRANGVSFTFVNVQDGMGNGTGHRTEAELAGYLFEAPGSDDRHNLCGSDPWLFGLQNGLFHPKAPGHAAQAEVVAGVLSGLDWSGLDAVWARPVDCDLVLRAVDRMSPKDRDSIARLGRVNVGRDPDNDEGLLFMGIPPGGSGDPHDYRWSDGRELRLGLFDYSFKNFVVSLTSTGGGRFECGPFVPPSTTSTTTATTSLPSSGPLGAESIVLTHPTYGPGALRWVSLSDYVSVIRFVDDAGRTRWESPRLGFLVRGFETDRAGNYFVMHTLGGPHTRVVVLRPIPDGFADFNSLPSGPGSSEAFASRESSWGDVLGNDGIFEVTNAGSSCIPSCAEAGITSRTVYRWNGSAFERVPG